MSNGTRKSDKQVEDHARHMWETDANLRAEFGHDFGCFHAYQRAANRGAVRVLGERNVATARANRDV